MHDLRRTLGSWLALQGHSLSLIGRALNHSNVSKTQIYARLDLGLVRDALEKNPTLMLGINDVIGSIERIGRDKTRIVRTHNQ
jgi:integrase